MSPEFILVADDYGLSPGVSAGIRQLISASRLSGTGCMTIFPEWPEEVVRLKECPGVDEVEIGQHLTLTDFPSLTGFSLERGRPMPPLASLIATLARTSRFDAAIKAELDAQLAAFIAAWGRAPDYFDGHQHVHFLRPVRAWLQENASRLNAGSWLRGAPAANHGESVVLGLKIGVVRFLARGFDREMKKAGYRINGPLTGFYEWKKPDGFTRSLSRWINSAPAGSVIMCHPGYIDDLLKSRDGLVAARAVELQALLEGAPVGARARIR